MMSERTFRRAAVATVAGLALLGAGFAIGRWGPGAPSHRDVVNNAAPAPGTSSTAEIAAVPGAVVKVRSAAGREFRVTLRNTWNPSNPNAVVRVEGAANPMDGKAWTYRLDDGTELAVESSPDEPGAIHLWLGRGVPDGRKVVAYVYRAEGAEARFVVPPA